VTALPVVESAVRNSGSPSSYQIELERLADWLGDFVIAGDADDKPRADLKRPWDLIVAYARRGGVRIHDLRHTHASTLAPALAWGCRSSESSWGSVTRKPSRIPRLDAAARSQPRRALARPRCGRYVLRKENRVSRELWYFDHDFTEEQWNSIIEPLGSVAVTRKDRYEIVSIGENYLDHRSRESAAERLKLIVRPAQIAGCFEDLYKAAWKLRQAMVKAKLDYETLPPEDYLTWEEWNGQTHESEGFRWKLENWNNFITQLSSLERLTKLKARQWRRTKAPPNNVDSARDEAWGSLAEIYVGLTGAMPKASPRTSKTGKYAKGYAGFVEAFMAVIPGEDPISDDEIPNFLRTQRYRERIQNFLDAHHGLLREPQSKKPPKRS
jgi:hypothetical protein